MLHLIAEQVRVSRNRHLVPLAVALWLASGLPSAAQPAWLPAVDLAGASAPKVGVDAAGNAVAVWSEASGARAAYYDAVTGGWSAPVALSAPGVAVIDLNVAMNAAGQAAAVWTTPTAGAVTGAAQAAVFTPQTRQWSAARDVATFRGFGQVGIDTAGNVFVLAFGSLVTVPGFPGYKVARYSAATGTWESPAEIWFDTAGPAPLLKVAGNGDAAVTLTDTFLPGDVRVVTYRAATNTWQQGVTLSEVALSQYSAATLAADDSGRFLATWVRRTNGVTSTEWSLLDPAVSASWTTPAPAFAEGWAGHASSLRATGGLLVGHDLASLTIRGARFDVVSRTWGAPVAIGSAGAGRPASGAGSVARISLSTASTGAGMLAWDALVGGSSYVRAARYDAVANQWSTQADLTTARADGPYAAVSPDGTGLVGWASGAAVAQVSRYGTPVGSPNPVLAPAVVSRPAVTLTWTPPQSGPAPSAYTVIASVAPGGAPVAQLSVGNQTSLSTAAPDGTFYVRVLARVNGIDVASNEVRVDIAPPTVPSAPQSLSAVVAGSVIQLNWQPPASAGGSTISAYLLDAGSNPGASDLAAGLSLGAGTGFVSPPVPNGNYYVRVRAQNTAGTSLPSNEVRVVVGPPPPGAPALSGSGGSGGAVTLSWSVPGTGASVTGYEIHAGSSTGASNLAVVPVPAAQVSFAATGVPAGTYFVRVVATSGSGPGAFSNEIVVVVP